VLSFDNSRQQLRREAAKRQIKINRHLATTTAPTVYLQDLSSIIGRLLALAGLTAGYLNGRGTPPPRCCRSTKPSLTEREASIARSSLTVTPRPAVPTSKSSYVPATAVSG
jgi:hypothetical protein